MKVAIKWNKSAPSSRNLIVPQRDSHFPPTPKPASGETGNHLFRSSYFNEVFKGQFHQHSTLSFNVCKLRAQLLCAYVLGLYFTGVSLPAQKLHIECWWNWAQVSFYPPFSTYYSRGLKLKFIGGPHSKENNALRASVYWKKLLRATMYRKSLQIKLILIFWSGGPCVWYPCITTFHLSLLIIMLKLSIISKEAGRKKR